MHIYAPICLYKALHEALHEALLEALHGALLKLYSKLYAKLCGSSSYTKLYTKLYLKLAPFYKANLYLLIVLNYYLKLAYKFMYSSCSKTRAAVVVRRVQLLRLRSFGRDNKTTNWNRANRAT